ncbi:cytochrome c biogenesis protein [Nitratidesulfovibrio vulgaris]|jgi:heme exporter protein C|uniref:Heme exporter protein C n=2 Tax=Nitratidesulfovibrio vulgaris TaxID=881 RepID=Q72D82_NITV2|nr:cytochrome c biogenesis protein CcsA [Nitratidesulfovibrio vulgaris]GEB81427.1 cytochrome C biogenesis protein CcmC [Desulfovibrio desulfuricans]HBW16496.1 cytochrome C biogenesis protein CcmC [Desulfovibrio sp.]AAS95527.1 cytochrome c-type biogenesis protein CcmC [Nitratidesulfovibrio vulgaris str. Hildenborough]ABM28962.1 cytochrome c assembly protein [Nitratidesulfovibrio vulgaris DP4]ADP86130.1 cytochrome c assembly protein [Nitratidesulfovibrio vulgaris RCH1]
MRNNWLAPLALAAGAGLAVCQYLIYVYAPVESMMGLVQKIFYTHLPLAWWSFVSFFTVFIASIAFLRTRDRRWDSLAGAAAEVGVLCSGLALVTGSIWGRHSWGVWWTWDPRLTTTLVMWFVYAGYLVLRSMNLSRDRQATVSAVVGIAAFVDVPLVFLSARLWRSIHPAVFASRDGGLEPEMKLTAVVCVAVFGLMWAALTGVRYMQTRQTDRLDTLATREAL